MKLLTPAEYAYLDMIEADGRLDQAASAFGYLLTMDADWTCQRRWPSASIPSIQSEKRVFRQMTNVLVSGNGSPMALLRAALVLSERRRCVWAVELYLLAALSCLIADGGGGGPDEAACLYAIGRFYAVVDTAVTRNDRPVTRSVRFFEWARRVTDGHRADWPLPDYLRTDDKSGGGSGSIWATVCAAELEELLKAAQRLDPNRALRAVQAACRLSDQCYGVAVRRRAVVTYELGVRYAAVGAPDQAVKAFERCAKIAAKLNPYLVLEARLEAYRTALDRVDDDALRLLTENVTTSGRGGRLLMKSMATRGRLAAYSDRPMDAYRYSEVAAAVLDGGGGGDGADVYLDSARLHAAIGQTCAFLQVNFWSLDHLRFDLLDDTCLWTNDHRPPAASPISSIYREYDDDGHGHDRDDGDNFEMSSPVFEAPAVNVIN